MIAAANTASSGVVGRVFAALGREKQDVVDRVFAALGRDTPTLAGSPR